MTAARFITVEGIDGAGKSSHLEFLASSIRARGVEAVLTREPGGTPLGEKLRGLVLHEPMDGTTEALVMFAARREHLVQVIEPALRRGAWVVSDRFSDATYAYQCGGRGLDRAVFRALESLVHPGRQPDATFLFDLAPEIAWERQRAQSRTPDKFEREEGEFFRRVRDAYLERARQAPERFRVIDASGSLEEVRARLAESFARAFP
ncbi:MAG TPA: dTMP kinase [Usitatibacteraceae bacterium]|nr:dTMP kinase [Usitatibacteraceae bacterium]